MRNVTTVTIPTPLGPMMKPIRSYDKSRAELRQRQEEYFLNLIAAQDVSVSARSLAELTKGRNDIPGYECDDGMPSYRYNYIRTDSVSAILKRLEKKGKVISTLYGRYRRYSVPVAVPMMNMKEAK